MTQDNPISDIGNIRKHDWIDLLMAIGAIVLMIICAVYMCACTFTINMTHTNGYANDVVDDTPSVTPTVSATLRPTPLF